MSFLFLWFYIEKNLGKKGIESKTFPPQFWFCWQDWNFQVFHLLNVFNECYSDVIVLKSVMVLEIPWVESTLWRYLISSIMSYTKYYFQANIKKQSFAHVLACCRSLGWNYQQSEFTSLWSKWKSRRQFILLFQAKLIFCDGVVWCQILLYLYLLPTYMFKLAS